MKSACEADIGLPTTIGVYPPEEIHRVRPLADSLDMVLPMRLLGWDGTTPSDFDALLVLQHLPNIQAAAERSGIRCLTFLPRSSLMSCTRKADLRFAASPALPVCLRGWRTTWTRVGAPEAMRPIPDDEILAQWDETPVWIRRRIGETLVDYVNVQFPDLGGVPPGIAFRMEGFLPFVPLLQFFKEVVGAKAWQPPPLRACFLFDDPNLRRMTYGFLSYPDLIAYVTRLGIHVCIAVVPHDMSSTNDEVAALFRANSRLMSIAIHGINHTKLELLKLQPGALAIAAFSESLKWVEHMESRHNLKVSRIIEAPHGIFSFPLADAMGSVGYEGALVSLDFLARADALERLPLSSGMLATQILPGGLCGIPRIRLTPTWRRDVVLAVLLGQPIVVAGHHWDVRDGLDFLGEIASEVSQRAGSECEWTNLSTIARSAYLTRLEGSTLRVRPLCRHTVVPIPEGVSSICVDPLPLTSQEQNMFIAQFLSAKEPEPERHIISGTSIAVHGMTSMNLVLQVTPQFDVGVAPFQTGLWPRVRKVLTEMRDRAYLVTQFSRKPAFRC
jgi:hypothetical protein